MENQEIMNEEAMSTTEETTSCKGKKAGLLAAIVAGTIFAGGVVYKKVIKPMVEKRKAKKAEEQVEDPDAWKDNLHEAVTDDIED